MTPANNMDEARTLRPLLDRRDFHEAIAQRLLNNFDILKVEGREYADQSISSMVANVIGNEMNRFARTFLSKNDLEEAPSNSGDTIYDLRIDKARKLLISFGSDVVASLSIAREYDMKRIGYAILDLLQEPVVQTLDERADSGSATKLAKAPRVKNPASSTSLKEEQREVLGILPGRIQDPKPTEDYDAQTVEIARKGPPLAMRACPECEGKGRKPKATISSIRERCPTCKGTGQIRIEEK